MREFIKCLDTLVGNDLVGGKKVSKQLKDKMVKAVIGLRTCSKKIGGAGKFIDYFVHDILDYTILSKDGQNFIKQCSVFDVRKAVKELLEI